MHTVSNCEEIADSVAAVREHGDLSCFDVFCQELGAEDLLQTHGDAEKSRHHQRLKHPLTQQVKALVGQGEVDAVNELLSHQRRPRPSPLRDLLRVKMAHLAICEEAFRRLVACGDMERWHFGDLAMWVVRGVR
jgi:hypothetical protein